MPFQEAFLAKTSFTPQFAQKQGNHNRRVVQCCEIQAERDMSEKRIRSANRGREGIEGMFLIGMLSDVS